MNLIGKVAPIRKQIENKLSYDIKTAELQLLSFDFDIEYTIRLLEEYPQMKIKFVHTPLVSDVSIPDISLSHLTHPTVRSTFMKTCELASSIYDRTQEPVGVIIHSLECTTDWSMKPVLRDAIISILKDANTRYEGIYFCIENVTPITENYGLVNGITPKDLYTTITMLRTFGIYNTFMTFDICHYIMTRNLYNKTIKNSEYDERGWNMDLELEEWFRICGHYMISIHVASCIGDGVLKGHHGSVLTENDIPLLERLRDLCFKYCMATTWVTEVCEEDYNDCPNQVKSLNICKEVLGTRYII